MSQLNAQNLSVRTLKPHSLNPRHDLGDLRELTDDIRESGVLQALTVTPGSQRKYTGECQICELQIDRTTAGVLIEHNHCPGGSLPAGDEWLVIAGHRRHAAAKAAGLTEVPCLIRLDLKDNTQALLAMLRENIHRRDLTPLEELMGYEQLTLDGMTSTRIAQQTRQSKAHIDNRLALSKLPPKTKTALKAGNITLDDAHTLLGLPPEGQARALRSMGTKTYRQEVAREHLALAGAATDEQVANKLRSDYLTPYVKGHTKTPPEAQKESLDALARNLPQRVVQAWTNALGTTKEHISGTDTSRALLALATTLEKNPTQLHKILHTLNYQPTPLEQQLLKTPPDEPSEDSEVIDLMEEATSRSKS